MAVLSVADIKAHVSNYISSKASGVEASLQNAIADFVGYVEGKTIEADAIAMLSKLGYTVGAGTAQAPQVQAVAPVDPTATAVQLAPAPMAAPAPVDPAFNAAPARPAAVTPITSSTFSAASAPTREQWVRFAAVAVVVAGAIAATVGVTHGFHL